MGLKASTLYVWGDEWVAVSVAVMSGTNGCRWRLRAGVGRCGCVYGLAGDWFLRCKGLGCGCV